MNERYVRWVDQPDNGVINVCRQHNGFNMEEFFGRIEDQIRRCNFRLCVVMKLLLRNIDPNGVVDLFRGIFEYSDLAEINITSRGDCWNVFTNSICSELPAMVAALQRIVLEPALRQWNSAMSAVIPQGKDLSF